MEAVWLVMRKGRDGMASLVQAVQDNLETWKAWTLIVGAAGGWFVGKY